MPIETAAALRARAKRNRRSVQAEALVALQSGLAPSGAGFHEKIIELHSGASRAFDSDAALEVLFTDRSR